jgi:hypothetical protein
MPTKFLAKLLGLWIVLAALSMAANRDSTLAGVRSLFNDPGVACITGIFTLLIGLVIVLSHNRASGGVLCVIVTFYGWVALIKGLLFLLMPTAAQAQLYATLHLDRYFYAYLVLPIVLGGYLIYGGFRQSGADR